MNRDSEFKKFRKSVLVKPKTDGNELSVTQMLEDLEDKTGFNYSDVAKYMECSKGTISNWAANDLYRRRIYAVCRAIKWERKFFDRPMFGFDIECIESIDYTE